MTTTVMLLYGALATLAALAFVALVRHEKPLVFQWAASAMLIVIGVICLLANAGFWAATLMSVGVTWMIVQPLRDTVTLMAKIERGEVK